MNSMIDFTAVDAMRYTALIASIGISVSIFEDLSSFHHFTKNGLLSWDISKLRVKWTAGGKASRAVDFVMSSSIYRLILVTILVPSVLMPITLLFDELLFPLCLIILVGIILNMMRNVYGLDGSDHMNLVVFSAIVISSLSPPDSFAQSIGLWFIALQYVTLYVNIRCLQALIVRLAFGRSHAWYNVNHLIWKSSVLSDVEYSPNPS